MLVMWSSDISDLKPKIRFVHEDQRLVLIRQKMDDVRAGVWVRLYTINRNQCNNPTDMHNCTKIAVYPSKFIIYLVTNNSCVVCVF